MLFRILILLVCSTPFIARAAEKSFDFTEATLKSSPTGFVSKLTGSGKPGDWQIVEDDVTPLMSPLTDRVPAIKRKVLAQLSHDTTDERFPVLVYDKESYGDFTFTTRFKCVRGTIEQMAGVAFRIQDETNYYVVRASAAGNTFKFYKFVNGERSAPIGPEIEIPKGVWHQLQVECKGNQIRLLLNGKEAIPVLTDNSFAVGKIGFWTKSDSVSYFTDAHISYTPRVPLVQSTLKTLHTHYPRLIALKLFAYRGTNTLFPEIVASTDEKEIGQAGAEAEKDVIATSRVYHGERKGTVEVTYPITDRNGDTAGALRVVMKSFKGQTEANALGRALPIKKELELRISTARSLLE